MHLTEHGDDLPALLEECRLPRMQREVFAAFHRIVGNGKACEEFFHDALDVVEVGGFIVLIPADRMTPACKKPCELHDFLGLLRHGQFLRHEDRRDLEEAQIFVLAREVALCVFQET